MKADSPLWRVLGDPAQANEAEALATVCQILPDDGISRAWANVTFTDSSGRLNEVDVLALTKKGLFLIELKGWHGEILGDQQHWFAGNRQHKNPRILANAKAKRLKSVLADLAYTKGISTNQVPFIAEAVVMHGRDSRVKLDQFASEAVWALDGYNVKGLGASKALSTLLAQQGNNQINLPRANAIDALMNAAGLMPRPKQRLIGQYRLDSGEPLGEGPGWQDFLVTHPQAKTKRRIRLFPYPKGASRETRDEIDKRALREFRLTDGIQHPGIIGPAELLDTDEGPALVFSHDADEVSLSDYLALHGDEITFAERERFVQELTELVRFAHGQRLTHRALSPSSVRVKVQENGHAKLRLRDWDLARRPDSGSITVTEISKGLDDVFSHVEQESIIYLAPQTLRGSTPDSAQLLDVYGLGAVAFLILTNQPPASNVSALETLLESGAIGLDPRSVMPEISDALAEAIVEATAFEELLRTIDVGEFQTNFQQARALENQSEEAVPAEGDPLDAAAGEIIGERFEIEKRRGSGTTGVALQVLDYEKDLEHVILKIAKDDSAAARLVTEAEVLDRLDSPRIVRRLDGPIKVGNRLALLMTDAGVETLADRIRLEGRATIEQLENWGADLFEAAKHLEQRGVFHRDIKPSNLAVKPDAATRKPRLTLFDFSLSEEPLSNVRSGSRPYLDPYLGQGNRQQFDSSAERFAIAATLFELASSYQVWWPSGDSPSNSSEEPVIEPASFESSVAEELATFFKQALASDASQRHSTLEAMHHAWQTALAAAGVTEIDAEANDAKAESATLETTLEESGLSARALSALSRLQITTVGELLGVSLVTINQIRGLGEKVRREIQSRIHQWRSNLSQTQTAPDEALTTGRRSVESYLKTVAFKQGESADDRAKRLRKNGTLRQTTEDLARWLAESGDVATIEEISLKMLREYGSTLDDNERMDAASELIRAILDLDTRSSSPQFVFQSTRDRTKTVLAYAPDTGTGLTFDEAASSLETLFAFGKAIDQILAEEPVISGPRLHETLSSLDRPALRLSASRIAQVATGLSENGRMSSRNEAYAASINPLHAVEVALRGTATRELAMSTIEMRLRARFPSLREIPPRPALDQAVFNALPYLEWRDELGKYALRETANESQTLTNTTTTWGRPVGDPALAARFETSIRDRGALVLVASRKLGVHRAAQRLSENYGLEIIDLVDPLLDALQSTAEAKGISWSVVLRADAQAEGSKDRSNLLQLARLAVLPIWEEMMARDHPIVFLNVALMARLGLTDLLTAATDLATPRKAARWFVLPRPLSGGVPDLDGTAFPFGADGWIEISGDAIPLPSLEKNQHHIDSAKVEAP